jgi:hypothetical protein
MNARYPLIQVLRDALGETAARVAALLAPRPTAVPVRAKVFARRFALALALASAGSLAGTAYASYDRDARFLPSDWADGNLVDVQIRVDGQAAPLYFSPRGNDQRHYFQAFAGRNYSVVLRNNTGRRIGVLLAVDGLNVVNGEITRQSPGEPMYVLGPWESATIRGWRTSMDEVRRFVFVDEKRSYAERTGQANSDMGWIRVLAFREQGRIVFWSRSELRENSKTRAQGGADVPQERAKPAPEGASGQLLGDAPPATAPDAPRADAGRAKANEAPAPTAQRVDGRTDQLMAERESKDEGGSFPGTGWGERRTDPVRYVDFTPERGATDQLVFRYEYARGLIALGIYPDRDRLSERDGGGLVGFARPPRR